MAHLQENCITGPGDGPELFRLAFIVRDAWNITTLALSSASFSPRARPLREIGATTGFAAPDWVLGSGVGIRVVGLTTVGEARVYGV
jgi:hypothetical protein